MPDAVCYHTSNRPVLLAEVAQRDLIRTAMQTSLARAGLPISETVIEQMVTGLIEVLPVTLNGPTYTLGLSLNRQIGNPDWLPIKTLAYSNKHKAQMGMRFFL